MTALSVIAALDPGRDGEPELGPGLPSFAVQDVLGVACEFVKYPTLRLLAVSGNDRI